MYLTNFNRNLEGFYGLHNKSSRFTLIKFDSSTEWWNLETNCKNLEKNQLNSGIESCFKIWMINTIDILMSTLKFILGRKFWTRENKLWSEATLSASLTITFAIECDLSFPNIEAGILKFIAIKKKPSFRQFFGSQSKKDIRIKIILIIWEITLKTCSNSHIKVKNT